MRYAKLQLCPWTGILLRSHEGPSELQERRSKDPSLILHLQTLDSEDEGRLPSTIKQAVALNFFFF